MPKYIKLFENFIGEAVPYALDPTKTVLTGATLLNDSMYYAIFKLGRVYVVTKDGDVAKKAPGNVSVTLDSKNPALEKSLIALGGKLDPASTGSISEPNGGAYKHFSKIYFTLADAATGEKTLGQIVNLLNGVSTGSSGTSGSAGTSGKPDSNLADSIFGGVSVTNPDGSKTSLADLFRKKIAADAGQSSYSTSAITATLEPKLAAADKQLRSTNPEYLKLAQSIEAKLKAKSVDPATGKDKAGKTDQEYLDAKAKMNDLLSKAVKI